LADIEKLGECADVVTETQEELFKTRDVPRLVKTGVVGVQMFTFLDTVASGGGGRSQRPRTPFRRSWSAAHC